MMRPVEDVQLAVGPRCQLVVVRDHDDGHPVLAVDAAEQIHDLPGRGRVQVAGRLVGQQQLGAADQGAGDGHALLLPARELRRQVAHARGQAQVGQHLLDAPGPLAGGQPR
jgi:hypothetical protein